MSLSERWQAIMESVHCRLDLLPHDSLSIAGSFWLLTCGQPFPTSSFPVTASPCAPELIIKEKIWNQTQYLMLLPMFCCKSLPLPCMSVETSAAEAFPDSSLWEQQGSSSPWAEMGVSAWPRCRKGNPKQAFTVSQLLRWIRQAHLT